MNKTSQQVIDNFEDIAMAGAIAANRMLSFSVDSKDQHHITALDIFVEHGKLWTTVYDCSGPGYQLHIPIDFLWNDNWQETYRAGRVPESEKVKERVALSALEEAEALTLRERIGSVTS